MKLNIFKFFSPGRLKDHELELILTEKIGAVPSRGYCPTYNFEMRHAYSRANMGRISLRIGDNENIFYGGHIGYTVNENYRGNHYASRSCLLIFPIANRHGINPVWITCNPDNLASRRTCEITGGKLIEIVDIPEHNDQYKIGERQKCRYRFDL